MIRCLRGKIIDNAPSVVLDVKGVGYEIFCASKAELGEEKQFWVHHFIREDRNELYGFENRADVILFEMLLGVSGVGPKVALLICRNLSREKIEQAISDQNVSLLTSVPGLGRKLALKIIIELKSKLEKTGSLDLASLENTSELTEGLKFLGYSHKEIYAIIKKIPANLKSTQEQIAWALRNIKK